MYGYMQKRLILLGFLTMWIAGLGFGMGYLAGRELTQTPIIIEKCSGLGSD